MSEPPIAVGSALQSVVLGPPIGGLIATWDECNQRSFWLVDDIGRLDGTLGQGNVARAPIDEDEYREAGFIDESQAVLVLPARWSDGAGNRPTEVFHLTSVDGPDPSVDWEWPAFQRWLANTIEAAAARGEMVIVGPGGWEPSREPYVLVAVVRDETGAWTSVLQAVPIVVGTALWEDTEPGAAMSSMRAPADTDTVRAAALLVVEAVASWADNPHELGKATGLRFEKPGVPVLHGGIRVTLWQTAPLP